MATVKGDGTCERLRLAKLTIVPCLSQTRNRIHLGNKINKLSGRSLKSFICPTITSILENKDAATPEM